MEVRILEGVRAESAWLYQSARSSGIRLDNVLDTAVLDIVDQMERFYFCFSFAWRKAVPAGGLYVFVVSDILH